MVRIKNIRLKQYNYQSDGFYFVTIVTDYRQKLLLRKDVVIKEQINDLLNKIRGLKVDYYSVMSDHVHIIFILENCEFRLGEIVRRLKAKISKELGQKLWQPNFYEHVIRNEGALQKIREYVASNPDKHLIDFKQFYD